MGNASSYSYSDVNTKMGGCSESPGRVPKLLGGIYVNLTMPFENARCLKNYEHFLSYFTDSLAATFKSK